METKTIVVKDRGGSFVATLSGHPEIWGVGTTVGAAVYDLIRTHYDVFLLQIILLPKE